MAELRAENRRSRRKARVSSKSLVDWVWWMVLDVLDSHKWDIEYRYVFYNRKDKVIDVRKRSVPQSVSGNFQRLDACVDSEEEKIFIDHSAEDKALCLFHECLEIIFSEWKDEYFVPRLWGLELGVDPVCYLEAATWDKLSKSRKNTIKRYLPKGP